MLFLNIFLSPLSRLSLFLLITVMPFSIASAESVPVTVAQPTISELTETLKLSGSLTAEKRAMLSPRMDGLVKEVLVDAGHTVKKGEPLLRLDPSISQHHFQQARAATTEASAAVTEAKRLVEEALRLRGDNYISASELANRESNLALTEATLVAANAQQNLIAEQLDRHVLPAPFNGVISSKLTESGEWVNRGDQVLELVALDSVRIDVNAPQERFSDIHADSRVDIYPDSLPGKKFNGKIIAQVPVSNPQARSFLVRIAVDADEVKLLPGTSATAVIHLGTAVTPGLLVPRDAVLRHPDGGRSVFVMNKAGEAERRSISVTRESETGFVVSAGLSQKDRVIVRGNEVLQNGDRVNVVAD